MYLKKLVINGFKSFCDRQEITFVRGSSAIVGPNGCGKSNIVDAIRWVVGEQRYKDIRVNSMTGVIFKGTEDRKGLGRAEVRLTFVNDKNILPINYEEVEVSRVIFASGESEYYINNQKVRLRDIHELFFDTGIGKSAYSIMEQGKIDRILSNKPEDRRYIIEEAAGITKYKVKREDAENKLHQSDENIIRIRDIIKEVKGQYDHMKDQAEKAEKYKVLYDREIDIEIELNLNRISRQKTTRDDLNGKLEKATGEMEAASEKLESLKDGVEDKLKNLNDLENTKIDTQRRIFQQESQINTVMTKSSLYRDQVSQLEKSINSDQEKIKSFTEKVASIDKEVADIESSRKQIEEEILSLTRDNDQYTNTIKTLTAEITDLEQTVKDLEKENVQKNGDVADKTIELRDITDKLIEKIDESLNIIEVNADDIQGFKSVISENLEWLTDVLPKRRAFLNDVVKTGYLSGDSKEFPKLLDELDGSLSEANDRLANLSESVDKYIKTTGIFLDDVFDPKGVLQQKRAVERTITDLQETIGKNLDRIVISREDISEKKSQRDEAREVQGEIKVNLSMLREKKNSCDNDIQRLMSMRDHYANSSDEITRKLEYNRGRIEEISKELAEYDTSLAALKKEKKGLEDEIGKLDMAIQKENDSMSSTQKSIKDINQRWLQKKESVEKINISIAEANTTIKNIYDSFYENFSINLTEYESKGGYISGRGYDEIRSDLAGIKSRKSALGNVNLMAIEEYKSLEERYNLLLEQLEDLEKARKDINVMIVEINRVSEDLFKKTFDQIKVNFHKLFRKLFDGGTADMKLTDPENLLTTGIDIIAHPPGQNTQDIIQLSGGQRTMIAIALMFATFLVKPSPFCLLDEIDAALDEENVTRFTRLLKDFKESSQFVMITHNKKTIASADVMYGVTQEEQGVSKIVSAKFVEENA
jgi:chromosome segregation protein